MGHWAPIAQFGIAAIQAATVFLLFMRLKGPPTLKWVFAFSGFFWLVFLYGLSMTDYTNRAGWPSLYKPSGPGFEVHQRGP
jgi:caa(3)-type oxidase subunit IV